MQTVQTTTTRRMDRWEAALNLVNVLTATTSQICVQPRQTVSNAASASPKEHAEAEAEAVRTPSSIISYRRMRRGVGRRLNPQRISKIDKR